MGKPLWGPASFLRLGTLAFHFLANNLFGIAHCEVGPGGDLVRIFAGLSTSSVEITDLFCLQHF